MVLRITPKALSPSARLCAFWSTPEHSAHVRHHNARQSAKLLTCRVPATTIPKKPFASPVFMIPKQLSHYRLLEKIGAGGMGVAYRAHDGQLAPHVAMQVLPAHTLPDHSTPLR